LPEYCTQLSSETSSPLDDHFRTTPGHGTQLSSETSSPLDYHFRTTPGHGETYEFEKIVERNVVEYET